VVSEYTHAPAWMGKQYFALSVILAPSTRSDGRTGKFGMVASGAQPPATTGFTSDLEQLLMYLLRGRRLTRPSGGPKLKKGWGPYPHSCKDHDIT
jgi:hypothetical protein